MPSSRRDFLRSCALGAAALGMGTPLLDATGQGPVVKHGPDPVFRPLTGVALDTARSLGAGYADIRIARYRDQNVSLRTQAESGTSSLQHVPSVNDDERFGFGVRVLVNGTWGFAASNRVDRDEVARITREAVEVAKTNSSLLPEPRSACAPQSGSRFLPHALHQRSVCNSSCRKARLFAHPEQRGDEDAQGLPGGVVHPIE